MKKIWFYLIVVFTIIPTMVNAEEKGFVTIFEDTVSLQEDVKGSSIIGGNEVTVTKNIDGVGIILGNNINYSSVSDYGAIFGNNITIEGTIRDAAIFGNIIKLKDTALIERDIAIFGNEVTISGKIYRDVVIHASKIILNNATIDGNVKIDTDSFEMDASSKINNTLSINSNANTKIDDNAYIYSQKKYEITTPKEKTFWEKAFIHLSTLIRLFVVFAVTLYLIPKLYKKIIEKRDILKSIGIGCVFLIAVPIIGFILLFTNFGLSMGCILLIIYGLLMYLSTIITGFIIGDYLWKKYISKEQRDYLIGIIGITIIYLLSLIPYVGWLVKLLTILLGLGIVTQMFKKELKK